MSFPYEKIVLVTIDEAFFAEYGKFPLKRTDLAKIISNINRLGARVICVDLLMDLPGAYGEDPVLADALGQSRAILASQALFDSDNHFQKLRYPTPVLKNTSSSGYINLMSPSMAHTFLSRVRIHPEITQWEDGWPIAVQVASEYLGTAPLLQHRTLTLGHISIPLDQFNDIHIDFSTIPEDYHFLHQLAGITAFEFLDISDLTENETREIKDWVAGKIVIVGETSATSHDWFDTPVGMIYGSEIVADTVNTLLKGAPLRPASLETEMGISLVFLLSIALCISRMHAPWTQTLAAGVLFSGFVFVCTVLYVYRGVVISMTYNMITGFLGYFFLSLISYFREKKLNIAQRREKERAEREREVADTANQAKSEFLSNMSHELRTPLNAILGFSQIMARSQTLPREHEKHLAIISRSGEHLLTLINQVLDLSKIEAGRIFLDESDVDLHDMLSELEDMFRMNTDKKGLRLIFEYSGDVPRRIRTDTVRLRQVLINLLNNAIKFTEKGSVTLSVNCLWPIEDQEKMSDNDQSQSIRLEFRIQDTGPGIAPKETDRLFEAFSQTQTGRQAREGTGLGLAISKKFVQLMSGDIRVRSEPGRSTTFMFDIPVRVAQAPETKSLPASRCAVALEPGQIRHRILIADDRPDNREMLARLLEPFGFDLRDACDGQEAVQIWRDWRPHLIWMDIRMPIMDGCEAARKIRNEESGTQKTVIIAVSANAYADGHEPIPEGCDDFLLKPFHEAELCVLMARHLGVRFVHDDEQNMEHGTQKTKQSEMLTPESLSVLPDDVLDKFRDAVLIADFGMTKRLIEQILPGNEALAEALAELLDDFRFGTLRELFKKG